MKEAFLAVRLGHSDKKREHKCYVLGSAGRRVGWGSSTRRGGVEKLVPSLESSFPPLRNKGTTNLVPRMSWEFATMSRTPYRKRGKAPPTPTLSALPRKRPVSLRADFVLTKDPPAALLQDPTKLPFVRPFRVLRKDETGP